MSGMLILQCVGGCGEIVAKQGMRRWACPKRTCQDAFWAAVGAQITQPMNVPAQAPSPTTFKIHQSNNGDILCRGQSRLTVSKYMMDMVNCLNCLFLMDVESEAIKPDNQKKPCRCPMLVGGGIDHWHDCNDRGTK